MKRKNVKKLKKVAKNLNLPWPSSADESNVIPKPSFDWRSNLGALVVTSAVLGLLFLACFGPLMVVATLNLCLVVVFVFVVFSVSKDIIKNGW